MEKKLGQAQVMLDVGDITKYRADAIVNAANSGLKGGGGVDGAIHRAGGRAILRECQAIIREIGKLATGKAVVTTAGKLPARYVIHTVGPVWRGDTNQAPRLLASAYRESLKMADKMALTSVVFPSISTGAYGYPVTEAAQVALQTAKVYLAGESTLQKITWMLFSRDDYAAYAAVLQNL